MSWKFLHSSNSRVTYTTLKMHCISLVILMLTNLANVRGQFDPNFADGRTTIVHLFEWKWNDIALECERFLGKSGFGGVQVSPPNENVVFHMDNINRPWFERYQPVSYKLETRSGTELEFQDMVKRCNAVGVRIYVDAVINHMTSGWPKGTKGTGNSDFDATSQKYDAVPYSPEDFHGKDSCVTKSGNIENYAEAQQVRNCKLLGLNDLNHSKEHVQSAIVEFFNRLVKYGVAGFRIDASKHMWPNDLKTILGKVDNLNTKFGFKKGSRPFIFQEVIDLGNEPITSMEYTDVGRVTEFKFGKDLGRIFRKEVQAKYLNNFGEGWNMLKSDKALVFVDNHDNQRGHGAGGQTILTFRDARLYKMAVSFMLAWPYGIARIMSSYFWERNMVNGKDQNDWIGPPHDNEYNILNVTIKEDFTCGNGWICEHRWREIYKMINFRNVVGDAPLRNWWDNALNQFAFARNGKGFIAINNDDFPLIASLNTTLPAGTYCDLISGGLNDGKCVGKSVTVSNDGLAKISIDNSQEDPMLAIHIREKIPSLKKD